MRILHVIETLEHGGAEAVVTDLANATAAGHEVTVCCTRRRGPLAERLSAEVAVICLHAGEGNDARLPFRLAREIRRRGIDVVHGHSWGGFLETVAAAWLTRRPVVHTVHGPYLRHADDLDGRLRAWLRRRLERLAARRVSAIACVSEPLREYVQQTMRLTAPVQVLHNGIPATADQRRHAHDGAPRLVSVGRLASIKGYDVLLRAFAALSQRHPRARLTLVGDGPERDTLERLAERLCVASSVDFLGFRDDVADVLARHDVFVLASRHEGISIAILEAMRAGLPVVATRVGGVPETVVDGVTGRLVAVDDPSALADAVDELLRTPANMRAMGSAGRSVQERHFSRARMTARYVALYEAALPPSRRRRAKPGAGAPLRILYHHRTQGRGAEGVHIASIVRALQGLGHEVTVVGPPGVDALATAGAAPVDKSNVRTRGVASAWKLLSRRAPGWLFESAEVVYNLPAWWRLRAELRRRDYDLIYERYAFFLIAGAWLARRHGVPLVLEANEVNGLEERARAQSMPRLCRRFEQFLFARCAGVLTVSSFLRRRILAAGVHPARVRVVPNAIEPQLAEPVPEPDSWRERYGLRGRTVVGFAGWFDRWDRLDLLLDSVAALRQEFPDLTALLVGDGPVAGELRRQARDLGIDEHVVFTGPVPRAAMQEHLALFDVAVLPHSNRFGSPVVLFEFMARGLPVVAPRLDPITDVLLDDVTGRLFKPLDATGLQRALAALLGSEPLRRRLGDTARERVLGHHTWEDNARVILAAAGFAPPAPPVVMEVRRAS